MCLSTVTETHDPGIPSDGRTYFKVMAWVPGSDEGEREYRFPFFEYTHGKVRLGETLNDDANDSRYGGPPGQAMADDRNWYPLGFHVFDTLAAAQSYAFEGTAILEVLVDKVVACGTQWVRGPGGPKCPAARCVTVARQMTLVRELERRQLRPFQDTV